MNKSHREHWGDTFEAEFEKESDRASVILAAAMLDQALDTLLRARLIAGPTSDDPLFDGANAPLATFSAKIDLAYRIGLTSTQFTRDLHLIRKIRNEFAHNVSGCTFDDSSVRNRCLALARSVHHGFYERYRKTRVDGPKGDFQLCAAWMLFNLCCLAEDAVAIKTADTEFAYLDPDDLSDKPEDQTKPQKKKKPNQSPEPTVMSVTPRADARGAPATTVAHL